MTTAVTTKKRAARASSVAGVFVAEGPTDEEWAAAIAEARAQGLVHVGVVGETADGKIRVVTVNMVSLSHFDVVVYRAADCFPDYKP